MTAFETTACLTKSRSPKTEEIKMIFFCAPFSISGRNAFADHVAPKTPVSRDPLKAAYIFSESRGSCEAVRLAVEGSCATALWISTSNVQLVTVVLVLVALLWVLG